MKKRRGEKGQSMVEFALLLPVMALLLCGIIDFGWLYCNKIQADSACRDAARELAVHYAALSQAGALQPTAASVIESDLPSPYTDASDPNRNLTVTPEVNGSALTVSLEDPVPFLTGITSALIGEKYVVLQSQCTMQIENGGDSISG